MQTLESVFVNFIYSNAYADIVSSALRFFLGPYVASTEVLARLSLSAFAIRICVKRPVPARPLFYTHTHTHKETQYLRTLC